MSSARELIAFSYLTRVMSLAGRLLFVFLSRKTFNKSRNFLNDIKYRLPVEALNFSKKLNLGDQIAMELFCYWPRSSIDLSNDDGEYTLHIALLAVTTQSVLNAQIRSAPNPLRMAVSRPVQ